MNISRITATRLGKGVIVAALTGALSVMGAGAAFATSAGQISGTSSTAITIGANGDAGTTQYLTTMGARAGSAGPDFLGITNMNYDFQKSHSSNNDSDYAYSKWSADLATNDQFNRLAIWCSGVNTNANPYYQNLMAHYLTGSTTTGAQEATTYHINANSWGDVCLSNGSGKAAGTVITANYAPDIIFGANKTTNWSEGDYATGTKVSGAASSITGYNPTYANNDSTNIWTQMYSIEQLARTANTAATSLNKTLRYGDATTTALAYEKAIKGQMLYVASQLADNATSKKTVAYLYAIDSMGTADDTSDDCAYFFVPTATGLASGNDTGGDGTAVDATGRYEYAANNSTINMGYMATLPFITNTFGEKNYDLQMIVEDITKQNPVYKVKLSDMATGEEGALSGVDVIIYNTNKNTSIGSGTSNGYNQSGVNNDKLGVFTDSIVETWAANYGFDGKVLGGDDFGTSTQQSAAASEYGQSPMLYCARNYTVDKNSRAAWAFSQVYPELYNNQDDSSYAYWLSTVYHINSDATQNSTATANSTLSAVLAAYTHQASANVSYVSPETVADYADTGYEWYMDEDNATEVATYASTAYYNGSSRASYYSGNESSETPTDTIGIYEPSMLWQGEDTNVPLSVLVSCPAADKGMKATVTATAAGHAADSAVYRFYYSTDGGTTWIQAARNKTGIASVTANVTNADRTWKVVATADGVTSEAAFDVTFTDPTASAVVTPAAKYGAKATVTVTAGNLGVYTAAKYRFYYSADGGTTWSQVGWNRTGELQITANATNCNKRIWKAVVLTSDGRTCECPFTLSYTK